MPRFLKNTYLIKFSNTHNSWHCSVIYYNQKYLVCPTAGVWYQIMSCSYKSLSLFSSRWFNKPFTSTWMQWKKCLFKFKLLYRKYFLFKHSVSNYQNNLTGELQNITSTAPGHLFCAPLLLEVAIQHICPFLSVFSFPWACCSLPLLDINSLPSFRSSFWSVSISNLTLSTSGGPLVIFNVCYMSSPFPS